mgnify:CR=1 FL=1
MRAPLLHVQLSCGDGSSRRSSVPVPVRSRLLSWAWKQHATAARAATCRKLKDASCSTWLRLVQRAFGGRVGLRELPQMSLCDVQHVGPPVPSVMYVLFKIIGVQIAELIIFSFSQLAAYRL